MNCSCVTLVLVEREVVLGRVVVDEQLHRADALRSVALDGRRDDVPAEGARELVGRDLASVERVQREVAQRALAPRGLVDPEAVPVLRVVQVRDEDVVRGVVYEPKPRDLGVPQCLEGVRVANAPAVREFGDGVRHRAPPGSIV